MAIFNQGGAMTIFQELSAILVIACIALFIGLKLIEQEDTESNIEIIHPVESIRCVSQDSKIVFCESYRE